MNKVMLSFHNDPKIKEKYITRVKAHEKADEIVKGQYWANGKGCAVGCTIHGSDHSKYETELGIPRSVARLQDRIFEGLPNEEAKKFPLKFLKAVPVGVDLSQITNKFLFWLIKGVVQYTKRSDERKMVKNVAKLYERGLNGEIITIQEWNTAAADAYAYVRDAYARATVYATAYAADAAAYAADADAYARAAAATTDAYARATAYATAYAAADYAAAYAVARKKAYLKQAKKLKKLLKEAQDERD